MGAIGTQPILQISEIKGSGFIWAQFDDDDDDNNNNNNNKDPLPMLDKF